MISTSNGQTCARGLLKADSISLFTAVEKQLGLKLDVKNVYVPSLVIEKVTCRVERQPCRNRDVAGHPGATVLSRPASNWPIRAGVRFMGVDYSTGGTQMHAAGTLRQLISIALQIAPNIAADTVINLPQSADEEKCTGHHR